MGRIRNWLAIHDPGGVDGTRAFHLAVSYTVVIILGYATSRSFGLDLDILFPMAGALTAMVLITFTPAANRRAEARSFVKIFGVTICLLLLVLAIGPGEGETNTVVMKLLLVPLTGFALMLRRMGMEGQRLGYAIVIIMTVAATLHPKRPEILLLIVAACQGAGVAALMRFCLPRPSALHVYHDTVEIAGRAIGDYLGALARAVRDNRPVPPTTDDLLDQIRIRVRGALVNASAETPSARGYIEAVRSLAYRLRVATQLLGECIPSGAAPGAPWRMPLAAAADLLSRHLSDGLSEPFPERNRMGTAISRLRQAAMAPDLAPAEQLALLRAVTAFERLSLVVSELSVLQRDGPKGRLSPDDLVPPPPAPKAPAGLSPTDKVAIQGVVATTITTALDFALDLNHAYWATMTVMFVLGNSLGETYVRVRYRTFGTIVGVVIGFGCLLVLESHIWILAGICLVSQMVGLVTTRDRYDVASAAIGLSILLSLHLVTGLGTDGMLARVYETVIGALVALAISWLVLPVFGADQIRNQVISMLRRCRSAFAEAWPRGDHAAPRNVASGMAMELRALSDRLPHLGGENALGHRSAGDVVALVSTLEILTTYLALLEDVAFRLGSLSPPPEITTALEAARSRTLRAFAVALDEAAPTESGAQSSDLEAALSIALDYAKDPETRRLLPLVADYLSFSEAVLRPLADLGAILLASAPTPPRRAPASTSLGTQAPAA
ncbi:FUSC family protein [Aquabacter spiritensis]|uniref:FUSC family protein n=1 Tax=Aquabacter spiritensis TaxID=933073 RepID=UPI00104C7E5B|nr:FUSC family protein [Aquabacter spiritensis]